jgi:hypothetical protein
LAIVGNGYTVILKSDNKAIRKNISPLPLAHFHSQMANADAMIPFFTEFADAQNTLCGSFYCPLGITSDCAKQIYKVMLHAFKFQGKPPLSRIVATNAQACAIAPFARHILMKQWTTRMLEWSGLLLILKWRLSYLMMRR